MRNQVCAHTPSFQFWCPLPHLLCLCVVTVTFSVLVRGNNPSSLIIREDLVVKRSKVAVDNVAPCCVILSFLSAIHETLLPLSVI